MRALLAKHVEQFAEDFARQAAEMERVKLKEQRDRKSDPETIRRNVEICDLRQQDRKKWSLGRLAKHFGVTTRAITKVLANENKWRRLAQQLGTD